MKKNNEQLGPLELAVMQVLWTTNKPLEVKEVVTHLGGTRAYTTVMTTLSRLHKKGYLDQEKDGRSYVYTPRVTRKRVLNRMLSHIAAYLFNGDMGQMVPQILGIEKKELTTEERKIVRKLAGTIKDFDDK